jgi:hypothetical protein
MTVVERTATRVLVAAIALLLAAWLLYGFGAGYFWPKGLPTPLNFVATVVMALLVLRWAWRYVRSPSGRDLPEEVSS